MENLSGKQLGRYQVIAPLGEGGMAAVYKAYQPGMERYVALKILPQAYARDPEFTGRFEQEAKVIAKLQHPHILPVHDFGEAESYTYIVMPLVETGTLADLVRGKPPLPLQRIRRIAIQVGDALDYAHSQGLIHRDVKPSNILIDKRGNCLLTDFGIAKMVEGTKHFTQTGGIVGTPHYMSPEQGSGAELTPASDIYSLGVVMYEMATGRVPFDAETPMAVVIKHMRDPLPPPSSIKTNIGPALEGVILKAMAKDPKDRYGTAADMVEAIRDAIPERASSTREGQVTTVPAPELAEREAATQEELEALAEPFEPPVPEPRRRSLTPWIVVGGLVLLGLCGLGTAGAYQLLVSGEDTEATESAQATVTEAALVSQQQTVEAADQIRTATARAQAATEPASSTPSAVSTAAPDQPALASGAAADALPGARWPVSISDSFDQNLNGWNPFQDFTDEFGTRSFTLQNGKYHWEIDPVRDLNVHDNPDIQPLTDFFVSVDAQQLSGPDSADYGVIFRRTASDSFYSFSLSDTGQYSLQVIQDGEWTTLLDWTDSASIQPGGVNRLSVAGVGDLFHLFINDQYIDSVVDDRLPQGIVGVVVDLFDPDLPATWEFDNFELRRPWESAVVESFEVATGLWESGSNSFRDLTETFTIEGGVYHWLIDCQNSDFGCISSTELGSLQNATDFEVSVEGRKLNGPPDAELGIRFRDDGSNYLEFLIDESGTFSVLLWYEQELDYYYFDSPSPAIISGATNRLTVSAAGASFAFYINDVRVGEIEERLLPSGGFSLSAAVSGAQTAEFEFDNFRVRQP